MSKALCVVKEEEPWYANGLRFKCTECGQCCTGSPGYTWVSENEVVEIARHLNISIKEFGERFLRIVEDRLALLEDPRNYDCVFLKDKKCSIYSVRPKQCRTFPWWPRNLQSAEEWQRAASFCEGINTTAPLVPYAAICEQRDLQEKKDA